MKIIFLSDAHLRGGHDKDEASLVRFLDSQSSLSALVVLGDLFDFWTEFASRHHVYDLYPHYQGVLSALIRLKKKGTRIIYLEGNHDFSMGGFFTGTLGASVYPLSAGIEFDDKLFYLSHGDTIAMTTGYRLWRRFLRSVFFRTLIRIIPPRHVIGIAGALSKKSRAYSEKSAGAAVVEENLKKSAKALLKDGFDVVIFGHSHSPGIYTAPSQKGLGTYANPGSWAKEGNYLLWNDGRLSVEKFSG